MNISRIAETLKCCSDRARRWRVLLVVLTWLAYGALYIRFGDGLGGEVGALAVIPVGLSGLLFGRLGGLTAGLLFVPLNAFLHVLAGESVGDALDTESLVGAAAVLLVGVVVGSVQHSRHEIRQARDDLEKARTRFEGVYNGVPVGLYRTSIEGIILDCNNALARMLGCEDPAEVIGRRAVDFYADPDDRALLIASLESDRVAEGVEVRLQTVDGEPIWARDHAHAVEGDDGSTRYFEGVLEDITVERQVRQDYRLSEQRFREAFTKAPIGMAIIKTDGTLLEVNQALADQLGFEIEEMTGLNWSAITHPDDIAENKESMREIVQGVTDVQRVEKRYLHKDGHIVWALM
ncbi:MAG: PAS domain S-box protein, partial [Acidimicrobiia bacterium]|nr:PAS domain S-box protein [Acidimicrobiia bacterium]